MSSPDFTSAIWTIGSGASLSDTITVEGAYIDGILFPATITGSVVSFQVGFDSGSMMNLLDVNGVEVTVPISAGKAIMLPFGMLRSWSFVAIRTGTSASATTQGASRSIRMSMRKFS